MFPGRVSCFFSQKCSHVLSAVSNFACLKEGKWEEVPVVSRSGFQEFQNPPGKKKMKIEQAGCKALQTKIHIFCQEEKVFKRMNCGF